MQQMKRNMNNEQVDIKFSYKSANVGEESYDGVTTTDIALPTDYRFESLSYVSESDECDTEEGSNLLMDCDLDDLSLVSDLDDYDDKEDYNSHMTMAGECSNSDDNNMCNDFPKQTQRVCTPPAIISDSECSSSKDEIESEATLALGFKEVVLAPIKSPIAKRHMSSNSSNNCPVDVVPSSRNYRVSGASSSWKFRNNKRKKKDVKAIILSLAHSTLMTGGSRAEVLHVFSLHKRKSGRVLDASHAMKTISTKQTIDRLKLTMLSYNTLNLTR